MEHRSQIVIADLARAVAEADAKQFGSKAYTVDIADEARKALGRSANRSGLPAEARFARGSFVVRCSRSGWGVATSR